MAKSANGNLKFIDSFKITKRDVVAGTMHIYAGALVNSDASGNAKKATDAASELFAGVAVNEVDQASTASAGDNKVELIAKGSGKVVKMKFTGVTKASIGTDVVVKDDDEVQTAAAGTNDVAVGTIVDIAETNYCWVKI
jgi:hypothetical protein